MNVQEAQKIARSEVDTDIAGRYSAMKTIHEAIRDGYSLCKVDELIAYLNEVREGYYFKTAIDVAINAIIERCK